MTTSNSEIQVDVENIQQISAIPTILEVVCRTTGMGFAAVARVTEEKWVACSVRDEVNFGLEPGGELVLETTICNEVRHHHQPVFINKVSEDSDYMCHPTPAKYGFESYISVPIFKKNGSFYGTLCAIDPKPAIVKNPQIAGMFKLFAELISFHIENVEALMATEKKLAEEQQMAELREQFIAILGHDLRNPISAISHVAQIMLRMPINEHLKRLATILNDSSYRMNNLISNVLDFARGRLGEGLVLKYENSEDLEKILNQVLAEMKLVWSDRQIDAEIDLQEHVECDCARIGQLFSNLLGNALTHGKPNGRIEVKATSRNGEFYLSVANEGNKIPEDVLPRLFQPFSRGDVNSGKQGLGLGLYIASQIAIAHNGTLVVESDERETRFTLRMENKRTTNPTH